MSGNQIEVMPQDYARDTIECLDRFLISTGSKERHSANCPIPRRGKWIASQVGIETPERLIHIARVSQPQGTHHCNSNIHWVQCDGPVQMESCNVKLPRNCARKADGPMAPGIRFIER